MHYLPKLKTLVVSTAVGAAVMISIYPANLNAITATTPYQPSAEEANHIIALNGASTPEALAQVVAQALVVGKGQAVDADVAIAEEKPEAVGEAEEDAQKKTELVATEPDPMELWLEKLAFYESSHRSYIKILDVNGRYSYGCLQFQEATFRNYALRYGLISYSTPTESVIYDCGMQKKIARLMIEENPANWRAWYTSVKIKGVGLPPQPTPKSI